MQLLRKFKINYVHIFGVQPYFQLNHWQLYSMGMILLTIVTACLLCQEVSDIFGYRPSMRIGEPSVVCLIAVTLFFLMPLNIVQQPARFELCKSLGRCAIAPFAKVHFRDFFLADVLTSASLAFADGASFLCLATTSDYDSVRKGSCPKFVKVGDWLMLLPFWVRLMQCLRRYFDDRSNVSQMYNAGKYSVSLASGVVQALYKMNKGSKMYIAYLCLKTAATIYSYAWDIYMDWGLLRAPNGLRP